MIEIIKNVFVVDILQLEKFIWIPGSNLEACENLSNEREGCVCPLPSHCLTFFVGSITRYYMITILSTVFVYFSLFPCKTLALGLESWDGEFWNPTFL